jgi:hypothetical protein
VREKTSIRVDLLDEVEAFAAAHGLDFDTAFARLLARGLIRKLESELAPLLDPISDAQRPGELTPGRASDPSLNAEGTVPPSAQPRSDGARPSAG